MNGESNAKLFLDFIEKNIGKIHRGWRIENKHGEWKYQIAEILNSPFHESITYSTTGVSEYIFYSSDSVARKYEFIISVHSKFIDLMINSYLNIFVDDILQRNEIKLGDIFIGEEVFFEQSELKNLFFYMPIYFKDELFIYKKSNPYVYFIWLIFITDRELEYIKENGWIKFVDLLEEKDPDLLDIYRPSIV